MVQGIIIPASDAEEMRTVQLAAVEEYQKAVGGWIEALDIPDFNCTMYLNEEALSSAYGTTGARRTCGGITCHTLAGKPVLRVTRCLSVCPIETDEARTSRPQLVS